MHEQWQTMHEKLHQAEAKALSVAREGDAKALDIASKEIDRRLEGMNELRAQISTERGRYVLRESYDEQHSALRDAIDARLKILENNRSNLEGRMWAMGAGLTAFVIILNLALHYWGVSTK